MPAFYLKDSVKHKIMIQKIDALLPQTQCTKCGFNGCRPYAQAISEGTAINRCPPGGDATIAKLAQLLDQPVIPLDTSREPARAVVAFVREAECIGCTKCIQACPVDAIVGAAQQMHTVISDYCTGCELCIAPCPVDCIDLIALPITYQAPAPAQLKQRYDHRNARLSQQQSRRANKTHLQMMSSPITSPITPDDMTTAHTAYAKAEKLYKDAQHAAKQACKRGHKIEQYQEKLDRLAANASAAKQKWEQLKSVGHAADGIA
jgi:electron transport complex protein RnfB